MAPSSLNTTKEVGGYDHNFVLTTKDLLVCPICTLVIRETCETDCGHRFCQTCLGQVRKNAPRVSDFSCPVCKTNLNSNLLYRSKACDREILSLEVRCKQEDSDGSCEWSGELRAIDEHISKDCLYTKIQCTNGGCSVRLFRFKLPNHIENICGFTTFPCIHCTKPILRRSGKTHQKKCNKWPVPCKKKCGIAPVARDQIESHYEVCPRVILPCRYASLGCEFKGVLEDRNKHNVGCTEEHLNYALGRIQTQDIKLLTQDEKIQIQNEKIQGQEKVIELQNERIISLEKDKKEKSFVWVVPNYANQIRADVLIYSESFYTSEPGYNLRLNANLYGAGSSRGTHIALYLQVMKGKYDGIMKWPFPFKITLNVLPQKEGVEPINCSVHSNGNAELLGRPANEKGNPGRGRHGLVSHNEIARNGFAKDDTIYFKVVVHLAT